jgi:Bacterial alpha-L-rhamnosidase C-terminal domain
MNAVLLQNGVYVLSDRVTNVIPEDGNSAAVLYGIAPSSSTATILNTLKDQLWTPYGPLPFSPTSSFAHTLSPYVAGAELNARFAAQDTTDAFTLLQNMWGPMIDPSGPEYTGAFWENLTENGGISSAGISLAHGWASTPTSALTGYVLGVQPLDPGYSTWQVKPQPGDLSWAEGQEPTASGPVSVKWAQDSDSGTFHLQVVSPVGTSGEVWVPLASATSSVSLPLTPGATFVRRDGSYDVYRVGAGTFEFSSAPVSFTSLEQMVAFFSTDPAVTSGLNDKLTAAAAAINASVRGHQLAAFVNQVNAQTGKALTEDQAQVLIILAVALR